MKSNGLESVFERLQRNEPAVRTQIFRILLLCLGNILESDDPKFRALNKEKIKSKLDMADGAVELLFLSGFTSTDTHFTFDKSSTYEPLSEIYARLVSLQVQETHIPGRRGGVGRDQAAVVVSGKTDPGPRSSSLASDGATNKARESQTGRCQRCKGPHAFIKCPDRQQDMRIIGQIRQAQSALENKTAHVVTKLSGVARTPEPTLNSESSQKVLQKEFEVDRPSTGLVARLFGQSNRSELHESLLTHPPAGAAGHPEVEQELADSYEPPTEGIASMTLRQRRVKSVKIPEAKS